MTDTPHEHTYGWSERNGWERFTHEHERGDKAHEHVLRDGGVQVKRTTWTVDRCPACGKTECPSAADPPSGPFTRHNSAAYAALLARRRKAKA